MKYSLRTLMIFMAIVALVLGWIVNHPWIEDRVAIEGTWQPTMARRGLQNIADHSLEQERWTVKDGKYTMRATRTRNRKLVNLTNVIEVRLAPKKSPKQIDSVVVEGPDLGKMEKGIYELNGDHLIICWGGATRPQKFEWKEDDLSLYLVTFKRLKPLPSPVISAGNLPKP